VEAAESRSPNASLTAHGMMLIKEMTYLGISSGYRAMKNADAEACMTSGKITQQQQQQQGGPRCERMRAGVSASLSVRQ